MDHQALRTSLRANSGSALYSEHGSIRPHGNLSEWYCDFLCDGAAQYNMTKESVSVYQERVEMSKTIATAVEKKASAAESSSYE